MPYYKAFDKNDELIAVGNNLRAVRLEAQQTCLHFTIFAYPADDRPTQIFRY